jgi:hydrogenase maturation protein HypF
LPGGDAAAQNPVQAAAGFLSQIDGLPDLAAPPFHFPNRYNAALELVQKGVRSFGITSVGRLFDTVAALLGFTREMTFEGQAAIWLEQLARRRTTGESYPFPFENDELDFRPLLRAVTDARIAGVSTPDIARAFQRGFAHGVAQCVAAVCARGAIATVVLSGGVFQNELLLEDLQPLFEKVELKVWINHAVPPNDGGISLGQAAIAAFAG